MKTEEERLEMGHKALDELSGMFRAWLKSDFNWALEIVEKEGATGEKDEWKFLWSEWTDKLENWMLPWVIRLRETKYITPDDTEKFVSERYNNMKVMLEAIYALSGDTQNEKTG